MHTDTSSHTDFDTIIFGSRGGPAVRLSRTGGGGPSRSRSPRHCAGRSGRFARRRRFTWRSGILLALLAGFVSRPARAGTMSYSLSMSSSLALLEAPDDPNIRIQAAGTNSHQYWVDNNNPVIEITNVSTTASINNVQLSIQNTPDVIAALKVLSGPTGAVPEGSFATNVYGAPATSIDISMLSTPLAPGASLIFMLELGPATSYADPTWVPGYQNVFFNAADPSKNAAFQISYDPPGDPTTVVTNTLSPLADIDPLAEVTNCSGDPTSVLNNVVVGGDTSGGGPAMPEPPSLVLLLLGVIPGWLMFRRRKGRTPRPAIG